MGKAYPVGGKPLPLAALREADTISLRRTFLLVAKNVVGWLFILASPLLGITLPGPGGIPVFLIGFALVTFPGKRKLTTRFLSGRRLELSDRLLVGLSTLAAVLVTVGLVTYGAAQFDRIESLLEDYALGTGALVPFTALAVLTSFATAWVGLQVLNWSLGKIPKLRRLARRWFKKFGLRLLPPRRKHGRSGEGEILELSETSQRKLRRVWSIAGPWLARMVVTSFALGLLWLIVLPLLRGIGEVPRLLRGIDVLGLVLAAGVLLAYLLVARPALWRAVLAGLGHWIPLREASKVWTVAELAGYLPVNMLPLLGRPYLLRPFGVPARTTWSARFYETAIILAASLMTAALFLVGAAIGEVDLRVPTWSVVAVAAAVLVGAPLILRPTWLRRIFNIIADLLDRPPLASGLGEARLYTILGLGVVGQALFAIAGASVVADVLRLHGGEIALCAAAVAVAYAAGNTARPVPAGLGVRELVLYGMLRLLLPEGAVTMNPIDRDAAFALAAITLRVWTLLGEIIAVVVDVWLMRGKG